MNKIIVVVLLICTVISLVGCQRDSQDNLQQELDINFNAQYVRTDGYLDGVSYPVVTMIDSRIELDNYYNENKDSYYLERMENADSDTTIGFLDATYKYDDAYFKDNILVLVLLEEGSGSVRHKVLGVKGNKNSTDIAIKRIVPEIGTDDMAEWHIMVELKREIYKGSEIKVIFE